MTASTPTLPGTLPLTHERPLLLGDAYLSALSLLLLGYAVIGKSFAYLGLGGVYVGELMLALGVAIGLVTRAFLRVPQTRTVVLLLALVAWCAVRAAHDLPQYGWMTLRDSVLWGYSAFALVVAGLISSQPRRLVEMLGRYRRFSTLFLAITPATWLAYVLFRDAMPQLPGTGVPLLQPKPTDILVHLSGIAALLVVARRRPRAWLVVLLAVCFGLTAARTRGGAIAFAFAMLAVAIARPLQRRLWLGSLGVVAAAVLVLQVSPKLSLAERRFAPEQLVTNALSVFRDTGSSHLDGPKAWRLAWWSKVMGYTFGGRSFWGGKGFGINLATSDGFDLDADRTLRAPHNAHVSMLARAGVPGLVLWLALHASWLTDLTLCMRASQRRGQREWASVFLVLIAYGLAFLVNASFDVYLEGPMGGIWFWCVFGFGLAATRLYRRDAAGRGWALGPSTRTLA